MLLPAGAHDLGMTMLLLPPDPSGSPQATVLERVELLAAAREAQWALREAMSDFLARPSVETFQRLRQGASTYVDFDRDLLEWSQSHGLDATAVTPMADEHDRLVRSVAAVLTGTPGTPLLLDDVRALRHVLLAQVSEYQAMGRHHRHAASN